jgi:hypothetical protein
MPSRSAETTAATGRSGIGPYRLAVAWLAGRPGIRIVAVRIGRPVIAVIAIGGILTIPGARCIIAGRGPGTISPVIAACCTGNQTIVVAAAIEGPQMRINSRRRIFGAYDQHPSAIIRIVEIRVIPAVPHKIAVPAHIRIAESQPERRTISESHTITIGGIAISISTADPGRIIGVIGAIIVKIGPARRILHF